MGQDRQSCPKILPKNWRIPQGSKAKPSLWHGQSHKTAQLGLVRSSAGQDLEVLVEK